MYSCWLRFISVFIFGTLCYLGTAQVTTEPTSNSPFSRLGLGDPVGQYFASNAGMAGISSVYHHPFHLNLLNPASHGWLRATAFEVGINAKYTSLDSQGDRSQEWDGNLNYLAIGFPIRNPINESLDRKDPEFGWGMSFTLLPNSIVNYDIQTTSTIEEETTLGAFKGEGGTYKLYWGNGFRYKTFSAGLNLGYLFGRIRNTRLLFFEDEFAYYSNNFSDDISVNGFIWNFGLGYDLLFKEKNGKGDLVSNGKRLSFGAFGNSVQGFSTTSDKIYRRLYSLNSVSLPVNLRSDTVFNAIGVKEKGKMPAQLGIGVQYEDINRYKVALEYVNTGWSKYENASKPELEPFKNSHRISVGGEYIPDYTSYNRYLNRVSYRMGLFYETDPRSFEGEQLNRKAVTVGLGLPIVLPRQQTSFINVAVEAGQFGAKDNITENYFLFNLGFTLNDNSWFFQRKFN